ncbi:Transcriptional regulator of nonfermentable carbon utilization [Knufia obscura]|uniref:Transcriptional regulator of nonfermentable carbon utilization n=1 Tax=Knufia obscura TaxID=1635080 RepID=A0ABR0RZW8_9EURO|nr:Transcriptional regulator of nonfermentable carbon utilization [Knufia obscura]
MDLSSASQEDADSKDFQSGSENDEGDSIMIATETQVKNGTAKPNPKDPNRPRRKKARRACFACDERPCQRCIKRGLADACQDGVRKKAKYLHDAPNDALLPGAASHYAHGDLKRHSSTPSMPNDNQPPQPFFQNSQPFPQMYTTTPSTMTAMPPPTLHERTTSFGQQSPYGSSMSQPMQSPTAIRQQAQSVSLPTSGWQDTLFGAEDPSVFNFDLASMNFGNHYGALEFGMLGKMATGAGHSPESEATTQRGSIGQYHMPFGSMSESPQLAYNEGMMDWTNGVGMYGQMPQQKGPNAFAIESSNMHNFTSPEGHSSNTPDTGKHDDSPMMRNMQQQQLNMTNQQASNFLALTPAQVSEMKTQTPVPAPISTPQLKAKSQLPVKPSTLKRPRDPSSIYTSVTSPYPYTTGFHSLIAYLQRRFVASPSRTLAIAKSLASIRPSFIATTKTLNREDLIFMEKCFQRTLWEYEGFIESVGTPTIVARRTGEIAAVGKEFQILTGWKKNVLLGREPNLNVNTGHSGKTPAEGLSGANTKGRGTGMNTPARRKLEEEQNATENGGRQQPVFLAELLDDESVVQFYEDFSRLAFNDSRGSVMGTGKLLKYRTRDDELAANLRSVEYDSNKENHRRSPDTQSRQNIQRMDSFAVARPQDAKKGISGESGMRKLGSSDGLIACSYSWTIKRDVFEVPMLVVINFLPVI